MTAQHSPLPPFLRRAHLGDMARLLELEAAGFPSDRFTRRQFRHLLTRAQGTLLVAEERGGIVGAVAIVWRRNSPSCRVISIVVDPALQGRGMGRSLLGAAEELARARGASRVYLEVRRDNARAIRFYEQAGFVRFGAIPIYYSDGQTALRYEKRLSV